MKLKCPNSCKVKGKGKFYRTWHVEVLNDSKGNDIGPDEGSWDTKDDIFRCVSCHAEAVEIKNKNDSMVIK